MIGDAVLKLRRRWRRVAADSLEPSMVAPHAPSLAREGPAHRTSATRTNSTVRLRSGIDVETAVFSCDVQPMDTSFR